MGVFGAKRIRGIFASAAELPVLPAFDQTPHEHQAGYSARQPNPNSSRAAPNKPALRKPFGTAFPLQTDRPVPVSIA